MGKGGRSGPTPKPKEMLEATGSPYVDRSRQNEPRPRNEYPSTDVDLLTHERTVFDNICARLLDLNILGHTDGNAIARYAKLLCQYNTVCKSIAEEGEQTLSASGNIQRTPCSIVRIQLEGSLIAIEKQFGLTPSARAGLETVAAPSSGGGIRGLVG